MQREFQAAYKQLNKAQRQAVDAIDGPVLVVAGPGTGKTELLSVRVANILQKTDADASSILCMTFTVKAATNMRQRLQRLIGPEARYVVIKTFHSFAAELMNSYPDYFWHGAHLSVAPDAVQLEIIQGILAGLPLDSPLASTFAGAFTALGDVQEALKLAKEAGLTPEELRTVIQQNLGYIETVESQLIEAMPPVLSVKKLSELQTAVNVLPRQVLPPKSLLLPLHEVIQESLAFAIQQDEGTGKTKHVGKWKQSWLQTVDGEKGLFSERRRNQWWLAVADVYESYREQLHARGYYDYSDMLIEVLQQLENNPDMRADVQERFLYVLIDEFQDTNAAQLRLAHLLADHHTAENKPNLMAVGDDDQSIFAFNGAELNNMLDFRRSYPDTQLFVLDENYRSAQGVLDAATSIIEQAEDRLVNREPDITKQLIARNAPAVPAAIEHFSYPTRQHQQVAVVELIKKQWEAGQGTIAVLARRHDSLKQLASILLEAGLPVRYERQSNVLEHEAVRHISLLAEIAVAIAHGDRPTVNRGLALLLRHPMWQLSPKTLWKLATSNYSSPDWLGSLLEHDDEQLQQIGNWLVWLARNSSDQPLPLSMDYILGLREGQYMVSPFREYYLALRPISSEYLETLSAVNLLQDLTQEFAAGTAATLEDFVRFIQLNLNTERIIADESWFNSGDRAVELLTIYKAKGLEFDSVFVVDLIEDLWRPRAGSRKSPANLRLQSYLDNYDDFVRLLYVAVSRAKHTLIATSYYTDTKGAALLPTPLLAGIPETKKPETAMPPVTVLETTLRWPRLNSTDEKALLRDRLENFSLSSTSLIDFLNVAEAGPDSFMERHLLRLPKARSPQGSYGKAIHAALETAQRLVNTATLQLDTVLDRFEASLREEHLPPLEFELYSTNGETLLRRLFENNLLVLPKGSLAEQALNDVTIGDACLGGRLDRIDLPNKTEIIIGDYKTGKPLTSFDTRDQTKAVKAWRHWTQLLFYCLLARQSSRFKQARDVSAQMIYVEADQPKDMTLSLVPTPEELQTLERLIQVVWRHISELDFPDTAAYSKDAQGIADFQADLLNGKHI